MTFPSRLRRFFLWACAVAVGLPLLAYLILLAINWQDEPPSEAALQLAEHYRARPQPADRDNAYLYLMGFTTPSGEDPIELGQKRVEWARWAVQQPWSEELLEPSYPRFIDHRSMRLDSVTALIGQCQRNELQCSASLEADPALVELWLKSEEALLERYRGLLEFKAMYEHLSYDLRIPTPKFTSVLDGQRLLLAKAWLAARQGDAQQVRELLAADLAFWRMALSQADILLGKLIAAGAVKQHFIWANRALAQLPPERIAAATPESWQKPLTDQERSMLRALSGEWMFMHSWLRAVKQEGLFWTFGDGKPNVAEKVAQALVRPLFLEQMSTNRQGEFLLGLERAFALPHQEIEEALATAKSLQETYHAPSYDLSLLRNLGTNLVLASVESSDYTMWFVRVMDLEPLRRAALLAAQMRQQAIAKDAVPAYLAEAKLNNPYTQAPFDWDAQAGTLGFSSPGRDEVIALEY